MHQGLQDPTYVINDTAYVGNHEPTPSDMWPLKVDTVAESPRGLLSVSKNKASQSQGHLFIVDPADSFG